MKKHYCYFHQDQITYFCAEKNCTMPLCEKCLEIHFKQYHHQQHSKSVLSINEAYIKAIKGLQLIISEQHRLLTQLQTQKIAIYQQIDCFYQEIKSLLKKKSPQLCGIKNNLMAVKKGSLKYIITYFSTIAYAQLPKYKIPQFPQHFKDLLQQCRRKFQTDNRVYKCFLPSQNTFVNKQFYTNRYNQHKYRDQNNQKQNRNRANGSPQPPQSSRIFQDIPSLAINFKDGCESIQLPVKNKKITFQDLQNPNEKPKIKFRAFSHDNFIQKQNPTLQKCQTKRQIHKQEDDILSPQQIRSMIKKKYSNRLLVPNENKNVIIRNLSSKLQPKKYAPKNDYVSKYLTKVNAQSKYIIS